MSELVKVANLSEVEPGRGMVAEIRDKALAVFNIDGTFYAIDNTCLHRGGPLGEGELAGDTVTCPWHGWEYNVKTGACVNNPAACVGTYLVVVDGNDVKVEL